MDSRFTIIWRIRPSSPQRLEGISGSHSREKCRFFAVALGDNDHPGINRIVLLSGKLTTHLEEIDRQAETMFSAACPA